MFGRGLWFGAEHVKLDSSFYQSVRLPYLVISDVVLGSWFLVEETWVLLFAIPRKRGGGRLIRHRALSRQTGQRASKVATEMREGDARPSVLRPKEMLDWDSTYRATFEETIDLDKHRKKLLRYARLASLPTLFFRIDKLPHTVIPRILRSPLVYVVVFAYIAAAALARTGSWSFEYDANALSGAGLLISFMIVFYVGYCYNRHFQQYDVCTAAQGAVISCCMLARANLPREEDRRLLWSCLNLAWQHVQSAALTAPQLASWDASSALSRGAPQSSRPLWQRGAAACLCQRRPCSCCPLQHPGPRCGLLRTHADVQHDQPLRRVLRARAPLPGRPRAPVRHD